MRASVVMDEYPRLLKITTGAVGKNLINIAGTCYVAVQSAAERLIATLEKTARKV